MQKTTLLLAAALLAGCGKKDPATSQAPVADTTKTPAADAPPELRLPDVARPVRYRAALEIDPDATTFQGRIEIDVEVARATKTLWLHAQDLTIASATWNGAAVEVAPEPRNFVALKGTFAQGPGTLALTYQGKQSAQQFQGMAIHTDAGEAYVVTHFEPDDARRVFPCFDEPGYKVPWQLELTVPATDQAFSNTAVEEETTLPDGRKKVRFRATLPLPSYLIALAVGPYDTVDAGTSRTGVPMRIVVPKGRAADAAGAAVEVGRVLAALEDYTGVPYPYDKLDHIVVPGSLSGAMEHPGLITYGPRWLLIPPGESQAARRGQVGIVAHELAHQWFGNLVTLAWWDDLWLNEAFATWMPPKVLDAAYPEMDGAIDAVGTRNGALWSDALTTARRIRQPITCDADMSAAFDGITYAKGATVIRMFERWLGEDVFREAVRGYLAKHAGGNATATDFLAALDAAAGKPVGPAFATFLDQAGAPQIDMQLQCTGGRATLALSQRRHVPAGAAPVAGEPLWQVPVCVAVPGAKDRQVHCTLLAEKTGAIELGAACPAWIVPNVDGAGYYVANLAAEPLGHLLDAGWDRMNRSERLAVINDLALLIDGGAADVGALLGLLPRLGASGDPYLVELALGRIERIAPLVADAQEPAFAALVRETLGAYGKRLGWTPRKKESIADARLRGRLMALLAIEGADPSARKHALALARAWLADHAAVPESLWASVLHSAVRIAPAETFPALLAQLDKETDRTARRTIYTALAQGQDPALHARLLDAFRALEPFTPDALPVLYGPREPVALQAALFDFVRDHADELLVKLPRDYHGSLARTVCDPARREEVARFLQAKLEPLPDVGPIKIAQAIEAMDQCIARRAAQEPAIAAFLEKRSAK